MFCTKCGNNNPDGVRFCTACGAQMAEKVVVKAPMGAPTPKPDSGNNKKIITIAIIVVIVAAIAVGAYFLISGLLGKKDDKANNSSIEGVVELFESALKDGDMEALMEVSYPESYIEEIIDEQYDGDKGEYKDAMKEAKESYKDTMEEQDIKIISVEKSREKKLDDDEKEDLIEQIEEDYDIEVKDVREVKLKIKGKEDGDTETTTQEMTFYKSGGKWYIYRATMFGMGY